MLPDAFCRESKRSRSLEEKLKTAAPADVVRNTRREERASTRSSRPSRNRAEEWEAKYSALDTQ